MNINALITSLDAHRRRGSQSGSYDAGFDSGILQGKSLVLQYADTCSIREVARCIFKALWRYDLPEESDEVVAMWEKAAIAAMAGGGVPTTHSGQVGNPPPVNTDEICVNDIKLMNLAIEIGERLEKGELSYAVIRDVIRPYLAPHKLVSVDLDKIVYAVIKEANNGIYLPGDEQPARELAKAVLKAAGYPYVD